MKRSTRLAVGILVLGPLASCEWFRPPQPPPPPNVGDYSCLEIPSELEVPGVIISRPRNGGPTRLVVDLLRNQAGVREEAGIVFREGSIDSAFAARRGDAAASASVEILSALLASVSPGSSIAASADVRRRWAGSVNYSSVAAQRTFEQPLRTRVQTWAEAGRPEGEFQYFLIRDALVAGAATIELDRAFVTNAGLQAAIDAAGRASATVSLDVGASYRLTSRFDPAKTICVVLDEITIVEPAAAPGAAASRPMVQLERRTVPNLVPLAGL